MAQQYGGGPGPQENQKLLGQQAGPKVPGWLDFVLPPAMFAVIVGFFTYTYYHVPLFVWAVVLICTMFSLLFGHHPAAETHKMQLTRLSQLCIAACVLGVMAGMSNYYYHMSAFFAYDDARVYDNVLPSQPAAAHLDAGKIEFAVSAHIDTTKTSPYRKGHTYCVAPILDKESEATSRVEFWAVGVDCCEEQVFSCDDAGLEGESAAHGGIVVMDDTMWTTSNYEMYHKAVKQAEAAFDIVSASEPMFIRWVADPAAAQASLFSAGTGTFFLYVFFHILINSTVAGMSRAAEQIGKGGKA